MIKDATLVAIAGFASGFVIGGLIALWTYADLFLLS